MRLRTNIIIFIFLVLSVVNGVYVFDLEDQVYTKNQENMQLKNQLSQSQITYAENIDFFREYSIILNNLHIAYLQINMAKVNIKKANEYIQTPGYSYDSADRLYDSAGKQLLKARELLLTSENKLTEIQNNAPHPFFKTDVENRLDQVDAMKRVGDDFYSAMGYKQKQLYEVNYGSKEKANRYYNESLTLIPKAAKDLNDINSIHNKIDIEWGQDWYPNLPLNQTTEGL